MKGITSLACLVLAVQVSAAQCHTDLRKHLSSDLALSIQEFDQTPGKGWRALTAGGCHVEALTLIERYAARNRGQVDLLMLNWHAAQMAGKAGDYKRAIGFANASLEQPDVEARSRHRWNVYVRGTVAFWKRDRAALAQAIELLKANAKNSEADTMNLAVLQSLLANFEQPYRLAYHT